MKKYYWPIYFLVAIIISLYSQLSAARFVHFLLGSFITFLFFVGIYFCIRNISLCKVSSRVIRSIWIVALLGLVFTSWFVAVLSGFYSPGCSYLVAKDIFTGRITAYCTIPPWHTAIIGEEESRKIRDDCFNRKSEFYEQNSGFCDFYQRFHFNGDWTKGPNP